MSAHDQGDDVARRVWEQLRELVLERGERRRLVSEALGMSFQRAKALRRVAEQPLALHELAGYLFTDKPYTSVMVRDLVEQGLAETRPHPQDGRSKIVSATPAGHELAARMTAIVTQPPPEVLALAPADLAELDRILRLLGSG